jgi:LysM repeat protein
VSWLKPMMLMMVLGAILYGVYVVLNKGAAPEPPPGVARDWAKPPDIQLGVIDDGRGGPRTPGQPADRSTSGSSTAGTAFPWASSDPAAGPPSATDRAGSTSPPTSATYGPTSSPPVDPFARNDSASRPAPAASPPTDAARSDPSGSAAAPLFAAARDPNGDAAASKAGAWPIASQESFSAAMESGKALLAEGKLVEALRKLTKWYNSPQLSGEQSHQLGELLSQLAGTAVYSRQHLLQPAYKIQPGDRLETIAAKYNLPPQLLAKINGIDDPNRLNPGDELKVVRGPFSAIVDLEKRQLTLIVEECYAGRFNLVAVGDMARNLEGSFEVAEKLPNGPANSAPGNPIHHWVRLGSNGNMWIVGTSDITSVHPSALNLNSRDAEDVYDILSTGSRVVVRR